MGGCSPQDDEMLKKGDLIKFIADMNPAWKDYVGTIAVVLNSEMEPVFQNDPSSRKYEKITIYSPVLKHIVTGPANNWKIIEAATTAGWE